MRLLTPLALCTAVLTLTACGDTRGERTVTGAAGGAVVGTVVGGPLLGAAAGGTIGAITEEDDL